MIMPVDPQVQAILDQMDSGHTRYMSDVSVETARRQMNATIEEVAEDVDVHSSVDYQIPVDGGEIVVRVIRPHDRSDAPVLMYCHGGGWVLGSIDTHDVFCRNLANKSDVVIATVDYRLAPEHPFPTPAEDCYAALNWIVSNADELGIDPTKVAVGGDSAGGNLAAVTTLMARDRGGPNIAFQLLIYPMTDSDLTRPSYVENSEGYHLRTRDIEWCWQRHVPNEADRTHPYVAPLRAESHAELPPAMLITAEYDPLRDEGQLYAEALQEAGVPVERVHYDTMIHGFTRRTKLYNVARECQDRMADALRKALE